MSNCNEIIERLESLAKHAVHYVGEPPFVMSLDDGIALRVAIDLLRKQEPRVLTPREFDEVRLSKPVWVEVRNLNLMEPALFRYQRPEYGKVAFSLIENRAIERDVTEYNWGWRCWSARPTEEQRKNTPWEGEKE